MPIVSASKRQLRCRESDLFATRNGGVKLCATGRNVSAIGPFTPLLYCVHENRVHPSRVRRSRALHPGFGSGGGGEGCGRQSSAEVRIDRSASRVQARKGSGNGSSKKGWRGNPAGSARKPGPRGVSGVRGEGEHQGCGTAARPRSEVRGRKTADV